MQLNDASETNENVNKITKYEKMFKVRKILTAPTLLNTELFVLVMSIFEKMEKVRVNFSNYFQR